MTNLVLATPLELTGMDSNCQSVFTQRIDDPSAVYLTRDDFNAAGDGVTDDAPALQAAIDLVRKQSTQGIVFVPQGTYRLGRTVHLWRGIRLVGYGAKRPLFKLGESTAGFQDGDRAYMVVFCHNPAHTPGDIQRGTWVTPEFQDGTFTTFYSGIDNIDFEIEDGNPAAVAVRYHIAQVCFLRNIHFDIGSGRGAVEEMGNIVENCTFRGGEFGIKTGTTAPGWQCMVLDCCFEGQRTASVITIHAQLLVIRGRFMNAPVGISSLHADAVFAQDTWFEDIKNTGLLFDSFASQDLQVNLHNVSFADVPFSVRFTGRAQGFRKGEARMDFEAPARVYCVKRFTHGLRIENRDGNAVTRRFGSHMEESPLAALGKFPAKEVADLPPQDTWVSIADMGAKGDGIADCTEAFQKAIAEHEAIYIPMGKYRVSQTLTLRKTTTLIGLHPFLTQMVLEDGTDGFTEAAHGRPLIVAPENGATGITGIGFDLGVNPGAIGVKWMAGVNSYLNDAVFRGGDGPFGASQKHSIWVTNGGGGIFKNIWIVDRNTQEPFLISNTTTVGKIYEVSVEHHKYVEVKLDAVANWEFHALQLEEDRGCEQTLGIYMKDCRDIVFTNFRSHRTSGVWQPCHSAIKMRNSRNIAIRGNDMRGAAFPWDNAVFDEVTGMTVPHTLFAELVIV